MNAMQILSLLSLRLLLVLKQGISLIIPFYLNTVLKAALLLSACGISMFT